MRNCPEIILQISEKALPLRLKVLLLCEGLSSTLAVYVAQAGLFSIYRYSDGIRFNNLNHYVQYEYTDGADEQFSGIVIPTDN